MRTQWRAQTTCVLLGALFAVCSPHLRAFAQEPAPGDAVPRDEYRIGVDDVLTVSVWDNKDLDRVVFVRPDGKISLPLLGEIQAGGLTVAELAVRLSDLYSKTIKGAQVTIDVQQIKSRPVYFVAGVGKTGTLQLTQELTVYQAISLAGGVAEGADLERAFVLRGDKVILVDFVKLLRQGDLTQNVKLQPGDTIVVPVADVVYVQGEIKTPGAIKYTKDLTILKAITHAGGFTPLAGSKKVSLLRGEGSARQKIEVDVYEIMRDPVANPDIQLQPKDVILVPQRLPGVLPAG